MYSINLKNPEIIISTGIKNFRDVLPHEKVIEKRKKSLIKYLNSYEEYFVIPSIICCRKTGLIIDGHHRYFALVDLGIKDIPVTSIIYEGESIRTHSDLEKSINKELIINRAISGNLLEPKSTLHQVLTKDLNWKPLILLSSLFEIKNH
jgi:ParB-like chromosome segregation protein Spo0J|tara:strand:- start:98 stop:544 length:447 start_codon:yes stop_codon:yes gene_type:complete